MKNYIINKMDVLANLAIVVVVVSLALISGFSLTNSTVVNALDGYEIYYKGTSNDNEVSLMFNVYWGDEYLDGILSVLKNHNIKTTFFLGGSWADDNLDMIKKILSDGHELGNHGYFHKDQDKLSYEQNLSEIKSTNVLLKSLVNYDVVLFAPPSGAYSKQTLKAAKELKMKTIMWSKDTVDWRDKNADTIFSRATKNVESGDLILMHPTQCTLEALDRILTHYENIGIKAVPVSKNILNVV